MSLPDGWMRADPVPYDPSELNPEQRPAPIVQIPTAPPRPHIVVLGADGTLTQVDLERGTPYDFAVENRKPYLGVQYGKSV